MALPRPSPRTSLSLTVSLPALYDPKPKDPALHPAPRPHAHTHGPRSSGGTTSVPSNGLFSRIRRIRTGNPSRFAYSPIPTQPLLSFLLALLPRCAKSGSVKGKRLRVEVKGKGLRVQCVVHATLNRHPQTVTLNRPTPSSSTATSTPAHRSSAIPRKPPLCALHRKRAAPAALLAILCLPHAMG